MINIVFTDLDLCCWLVHGVHVPSFEYGNLSGQIKHGI